MIARRLSVLLAGLVVLTVLVGTGQVFTDRSALAQSHALFIPPDSVVYQGRLTSISAQQTDTGLRVSASASESVSFVKTSTQVLSGATVSVSVPAFGYQATLNEASTGVYQATAQLDVSVQPAVDGQLHPMSELTQWSVVPQSGTFTLGNASVGTSAVAPIKLSDALARVDVLNQALGGLPPVSGFIPNAGVSARSTASTYQVPATAVLRAQVLDASGKPAVNRRLSVTLAPDGLQAQSFGVTTDGQGFFTYDVTYPATITVTGGSLANLSSPFQLQGTTTQQVSAFWWGGDEVSSTLSQLQRNLGAALDALTQGGADPVNLVTGNMYDTERDLGYPSPGMTVDFRRTYNSQESTDGPFGRGWTHSYNLTVTQQQQNGNGVLTELTPTGGREFWDQSGQNGLFVPRAGGSGSIQIDNNDQTYLKTDRHGVQTHYDNGNNGGRILWVRDPDGNQMNFAYDGGGHLVTITDTAGRTLSLAYDGNGHVVSLTDAAGTKTSYAYDAANRLAQVRYADGSTVGYVYDDSGDVVQVTDPNGAHRLFTYDAKNRATSFTYDGGLERDTFTYDTANNRTVVTDAQGYQTVYTYRYIGELGVITRVVDPVGGVALTDWDANGNRTSVTDPLGHKTTFTYDSKGNLTSSTDAAGARTALSFDSQHSAPTGASNGGASVAAAYDAAGNATSVSDPAGARTTFQNDAHGLTTAITDALGNTTAFEHDAAGNQTAIVDPMHNRVAAGFDALGHPTSVTDPLGRVTKIAYDVQYRPVKMTYADGSATTFAYDGVGNVTSLTDPDGHTTTRSYNQANQVVAQVDALGRKTAYSYDLRGQLRSATDPAGGTTTYTYDPDGRLVKVIRPDGTFVLLKNDLAGRLVAATDPNGHTYAYAYDARGRLLSVTDPAGGATKYGYDALGDVTTVTDPNGHTTTTAYDADRRPVSTANAAGQAWKYAYDGAGDLTSITYPSGEVVSYTYDADGHPTAVSYPGGLSTAYAYDAAGNVTSVTDAQGATSFQYDALNRVTSETLPGGIALSYTYDAAGNRTSLTTPAGKMSYAYDAGNQLTSVTDPVGGVASFTYNALGLETRRSLPNGAARTAAYDALGRVTEIVNLAAGGAVDSDLKYAYDRSGNVVSDTRNSAQTTFAYDTLDRLTGVSYPSGGRVAYAYDAAGNRTSMTVTGMPNGPPGVLANGTTSYAYDAADRMVKAGSDTLAYDADGELVSRSGAAGTTSLTWDGRHLLTGASSPGGSASYTYDAFGQLVGRSDSLGNSQQNVYDSGSLLLKRPTGATNWSLVVGAGPGDPLSVLGVNGAGKLASASYLETDGQGSLVGSTDKSGAAAASAAYTDFGSPMSARDSSATGVPGGSSKTLANYQDLGYLGQPFDPISGLELMHARWYAPDLGRFTAVDPMAAVFGSPKTINRYAYALDNPSTFSDPSGLFIREGLDMVVMSIPYVGSAYLLITALTGYDPILGRQLSPMERAMNLAFGLVGLVEPIGVAAGARLAEEAALRAAEQGAERAVAETAARDAAEAAARQMEESAARDAEQQAERSALGDTGRVPENDAVACPVPNSFAAGTPVLMADGSQKPIDQVKVGDRVMAEDPTTGTEQPETVDRVIVGKGEKHLVTLVIDGVSVTATDNHPFWSADRQQWVPAGQLRLGEHVVLADGRVVEVDSKRTWAEHTTVYNLSVKDLHTYFAGDLAILVHNCGESPAAANGRAMHDQFDQAVRDLSQTDPRWQPGLRSGPNRPDAFFNGQPVELKPDSPSGLAAGRSQLRRYISAFGAQEGYLVAYDGQGALRVVEVVTP